MSEGPPSVGDVDFLDFSISCAHEKEIAAQGTANNTVAAQRHRGSVDGAVDREHGDFARLGAGQQEVAPHASKCVVTLKTCVGKLNSCLLEEVLHRADIELESVNIDLLPVALN